MAGQILTTEYSDVMQKSFIDYSMSVITARAVPDVRDGLKPVQRRVLYAMDQLGLNYDKPHRKSARIVGDAMGKYHPHGDSSIYETLVVMEQDFKKGMALVDGHGNFGSIEGDGAAAMRYTEAKLKKFTQDVFLADLDKDVVDFVPNFDETEKEPSVLPVRVPNLLVNGAEGIAVGMTTSIPTHNLAEVIDGVIAYMDNPGITTEELMNYIPGPDFPTGGIVVNKSELASIYETGTGKIKVRGKMEFEPAERKNEKDKLVISEIPYTMIGANISKFISDVVDLAESRKTSDITDVSNESSKEGIRIVIELKKNADVEKLTNMLYKKTRLEDTFGVNMLTIVDGRPEVLGLKSIIAHSVEFQFELATRKYTTLLKKELDNKEVKEGLIEACDIIDLIIEILRGSQNIRQAKACLMNGNVSDIRFRSEESKKAAGELHFTERQATAILELRLSKLIGLEILALRKEYEECLRRIAEYEGILGNKGKMAKKIKAELLAIKEEYQYPRKTVITDAQAAVYEEDKPAQQEVVFLMDRFGYVKSIDLAAFERNKDAVCSENKYVFTCMNTDRICLFTDKGNMHQVKMMDVPFGKFRDKGKPIDNISNYNSSEERILYLKDSTSLKNKMLLFVTRQGMLKLVSTEEFDVVKKQIQAAKLQDEDLVVGIYEANVTREVYSKFTLEGEIVEETVIESKQQVILQTNGGFFIKFPLADVPEKKKAAIGVRGIKLEKNDYIDDVYVVPEDMEFSIEYKGKTVDMKKLKLTHRDGKGTKLRV